MNEKAYWYRAYGLTISADHEIFGLPAAAPQAITDLQVRIGSLPAWTHRLDEEPQTMRYVSQYLDENGEPGLTIRLLSGGDYYRFHYTEGIDYVLDADGKNLWICWQPEVPTSYIFSYLLGPVMGLILRIRGYVSLHASAVAMNEKATLFVGYNMAGKSTIAMALARLGFAVLSDDIVPLDLRQGTVWATPAYPRMRLRQSAIANLSSLESSFGAIPNTEEDKRLHFDLVENDYRFQSSALEVGAIYLLGERYLIDQAPFAVPVSSQEAVIALVGNTYANRFQDKKMRAEEFGFLSQVVQKVPIRLLHREADPASLSRLCDAVLDDLPWA